MVQNGSGIVWEWFWNGVEIVLGWLGFTPKRIGTRSGTGTATHVRLAEIHLPRRWPCKLKFHSLVQTRGHTGSIWELQFPHFASQNAKFQSQLTDTCIALHSAFKLKVFCVVPCLTLSPPPSSALSSYSPKTPSTIIPKRNVLVSDCLSDSSLSVLLRPAGKTAIWRRSEI